MQARIEGYRLSAQQRRLWLLHQDSTAYRAQCAILIEGPVESIALEDALRKVVDRHEILRTTFIGTPEVKVPVQVVTDKPTLTLDAVESGDQIEDLAGLIDRLMDTERRRPFDFEQGPLLRLSLLTLSSELRVLLVDLPAICADGKSLINLVEEISRLYGASLEGGEPGDEPVQYVQFAEWQNELLSGPDAAAARDYWRKQNLSTLPGVKLPFENKAAAAGYFAPHALPIAINPGTASKVRAAARRFETPVELLLLACWQTLLWKKTAQPDVVVHKVFDGRKYDDLREAVGLFARCIPIHFRFDDKLRFSEVLDAIKRSVESAYEWQHYFAGEPSDAASLASTHGAVLFELQRWPSKLAAAGAAFSIFKQYSCFEAFKLKLCLIEKDDSLAAELHYDPVVFSDGDSKRLSDEFSTLLESVVEDPDARLADLNILTQAEQRRLLIEFNDTTTPAAEPVCLHLLLDEQARRTPDKIAVAYKDRRLTYAALNAQANRLAHYLQSLGVGPDVLVGLYLERSLEMMVGILAVLKAGGAYLPLDTSHPKQRLIYMIEDAKCNLVLTRSRVEADLPVDSIRVVALDLQMQAQTDDDLAAPISQAQPENLAYVIYTSGSTGRPKGVMIEHRGLVNYLNWSARAYAAEQGQGALVHSPLGFDLTITALFPPLLRGKTVVLLGEAEGIEGLSRALVTSGNYSLLKITPAHLEVLSKMLPVEAAEGRAGTLVIGGEALVFESLAYWQKHAPRTRLINEYGPTETVVGCCVYEVNGQGLSAGAVPIGKPIANTQVYVLDERGRPAAVGVPGELVIGGAGLARGYLNHPELTAERFVPNPFSQHPGARLYRTGDLARHLPDGNLEYLGRIDNQVKVRGYRIELGEIEATLRQHALVNDAAVTVNESASGDRRLVAYLVARQKDALSVNEIRRHLREQLPDYMMPSVFVSIDAMPLTSNGKVDRRKLPEPESIRPELVANYAAPVTELERKIAEIWQQTLQVEKVGVNDNFFDLGGHSLLMAQVHGRLLKVITKKISMLDLFMHPTVSLLATYLSEKSGEDSAKPSATSRRRANRINQQSDREIAIIAMNCRFPGARNTAEFWRNLRDGIESISFMTDEELQAAGINDSALTNPNYIKARGKLKDIELFDASFFGFTPREAALLDPQHRLFLECAWEALELAGYDSEIYDGRVGVYAGVGLNHYLINNLFSNPDLLASMGAFQTILSNDKDFLPTRVSYKLNLKGPSINVQTACSTSLVAVCMAAQSLIDGHCDMAMAGGITIAIPQDTGYLYQEGGIASPDGHCRAFDARAQGTVGGNGTGLVVLKRLQDAVSDGDTIHAVIKGFAVNNDGSNKIGYTAPSVQGQAEVISEALAMAEVEAETITYIETHGTGTQLGDPIEAAGLMAAFKGKTDKQQFCAIGSVKSNIGHLDTAAGVAGLIKTVMSLKHGQIPASLHFEKGNEKIEFEGSPFYVNGKLKEWKVEEGVRRAGVSSFGIGGTNAHVIVEEWKETGGEEAEGEGEKWEMLMVSAKTKRGLEEASRRLGEELGRGEGTRLKDVAYTLAAGRRAFNHRRVVICRDVEGAIAALQSEDPKHIFTSVHESGERPVVFMFPGQGSQYPNMARELYETEPTFRADLDRCFAFLEPLLGYDLRQILYPADARPDEAENQLTQTRFTQPALFVIEYALASLLMRWGIVPQAMIGHSIGEYVAACLAGVFSLEDGLRLVAERAKMMQRLPTGAMLAISSEEKAVLPLLDHGLSLAAVNGPSLCVVAGPATALDKLQSRLGGQGVAYKRQFTSHAFHSEMMEPILDPFTELVNQIKLSEPQIPYISNLTGTWMTATDATDPAYWSRHLRHTVRFSEGLRELLENPDRILLEVGPGHTLSTLSRQHPARAASQIVLSSLRHPHEPQSDAAFFLRTIARLWLAGKKLDWANVYAGRACRRIPLPTYPFERQRHWVEPQKHRDSHRNRHRSLTRKLPIDEWFYLPVWKQSRLVKQIEDNGQPGKTSNWLLFVDSTPLAGEIARRLTQGGDRVATVAPGERFRRLRDTAYEINPAQREDYESLLEALRAESVSPEKIVHLWSVDREAEREGEPGEFDRMLERGFYSLLLLAQALEAAGFIDRLRIAVVSNNLQLVTGEETLCPEKATLLGICKVIPQEYPNIGTQSIDIGRLAAEGWQRQSQIDSFIMELTNTSADPVVAYRGQQRWVQVFEAAARGAVSAAAMPLREAGVYLITGGLGNIAFAIADYLARACRARLVLTTRTDFPPRPQWENWLAVHGEQDLVSRKIRKLQSLEAAGAEVWAVRADAASLQQMEALMAAIGERFGSVNGVIHAAGVRADQIARSIQETSRQDCERHFEAKSRALLVLEKCLAGSQLDFCILLSSLSSVLGGLGFAAYASANAFMDAYVNRHNQSHPDRWVSINWDGWNFREATVTSTQAHLATLAITPADGVEAFRRVLADPLTSQVAVSTTDLQLRIDQWIKLESLVDQKPGDLAETDSHHPRPELQSAYAAAASAVEQTLAGIWQELLGIAPVGIHDNFFELGGDSILSIQVIAKANRAGLQFTTRQLFQSPTISELARVASPAQARADEESANTPIRLTVEQQRRADELAGADRRIQDIYPLSPMQEGMLFHSLYDPESRPYIKEVGCLFRGALDLASFERAWQTVIERHAMLRTSFEWEGLDRPLQVVRRKVKLPVAHHDLSGLREQERENRLAALLAAERGRGFDLSQSPVMRLTLVRMEEDQYRFIWSFHHLLGDGWSGPIILREVFGCYAGFAKGENPVLPPVRPYRDYIVWLQERDMAGAETFWREELKGFTAATPIRLNRVSLSTAALASGTARQEQRLPQAATTALQSLARQHQMTLNTVIQGAWAILLGHYSGDADVLFGVTSSGRPAVIEGIEQMVGLFINTLPLRVRLQPDALLMPWLKQLQTRQAEMRQFEYSPLAQVKRWSDTPRSQPLFESILIFDNFPVDSTVHQQSPSISINDVTSSILQNDYSLTMTVLPHADLLLSVLYDRSRFDDDSIKRLLENFQALLGSIAERPDLRLREMEERLTEADVKQRGQKKRERFESRLKGFTQARPKGISLTGEVLVESDTLLPESLLPLVIRPRLPEVDLKDWAHSEAKFIQQSLEKHGALLLRGFKVNSISAFADFTRANCHELLDYREGSTPRTDLGNQIYTSTEYPPDQSIPLHNEMSYSRNWPAKIWFYCVHAANRGGETPIADSRKVFQMIDPKIRERFMRKKVLYVRNYGEGLDLSWQRAFQTDDRSAVEQYCRKAHIELEWRDGDRLRTRQVCQAVVNHPLTGEASWFNQAHLFHWSNLEATVAESLLSIMKEEELPRNAFYGDGTPLETSILDEIRAIYRAAAVVFPWQRHDILMVDNVLAAHGRMPFEGERKIVVTMADLFTNDNL